MPRKIIDLHGNVFNILEWELYLEVPSDLDKLLFTRDCVSGESFLLGIKNNTYSAYFYSMPINCYIGYELGYQEHDKSKDIRKVYGKK